MLSVLDSSELSAEQRKVPKAHMREGLGAMACYLDRLRLPLSAPAVDLTHMKLNMIPAELFVLSQLTLLDLKDNLIEELPQSLKFLSKLKHLDLSSNQLQSLDSSLGFLTDLTWLSVAKNRIRSVPATVKLLQSLRFLDLHVNMLTTILSVDKTSSAEGGYENTVDSTGLSHISVRLHISSSKHSYPRDAEADNSNTDILVGIVHNFPSGFAVITSLRDLELSYNKLKILPDLRSLSCLKRLNISHNILEALPDELCELWTLGKLEAGDNRIHVIPRSISNLTVLSVLSLKNNSLSLIPDELCGCHSLRYLSLNANNLLSLPLQIFALTALSRLTIAANNIQFLPNQMDKMSSLTHLDLSHNPLRTIPPSLGARHDSLKTFLVQNCPELQDPPQNIISAGHEHLLNYMRKVWRGVCTARLVLTGLSMGSIVCLPHFDFSSLVEIRIDRNEIKIIPDIICSFENLLSLRFRDNLVSALPADTSKLLQLKELDMSKNRFKAMPQVVLKMTHLARLRCGENPIPFTISSDWIEGGVKQFLSEYIRETTGRRIAGMFMNSNLSENFVAWKQLAHPTLQ